MKKSALFFVCFCFSFFGYAQYNNDIIIESLIKTDTTVIGQKLGFPQVSQPEVTLLQITIPPGKSTGWHKHEFPVFAYVLEGTLTVEIENHETMQYQKNTTFAEVINTFHKGTNNTNTNVVLIAFFMGEKGKPLSIHADAETNK